MSWFKETIQVLKEPGELSAKETFGLIVLLYLIGFFIRFRLMAGGVLWLDEGYTILLANLSFDELLARGPCDANPVLSSRLYRWWVFLFGSSLYSYESLSVFFGALSVPAVGYLAYRLLGSEVALWSSFLMATSGFHLQYSQFIRIYAFAVFVSILAAIFLIHFLETRRSWSAILFLITSLILANSHYIGLLVVGTFFIYGLASEARAKRSPVLVFGLGIIFTFLYAPTLLQLYEQYIVDNRASWIKDPPFETAVSLWYYLSSESVPLLISLLSAAVYGVFIVESHREDERKQWFDESHRVMFLLIWLMWPFFVMFGASFIAPSFFHGRYFIFLLVPFLILVGFGLSRIPFRLGPIVMLPLLTLFSADVISEYYLERVTTESERFNYEMLKHNVKEGDVVVHSSKCSFVPSLIYGGGLKEEYLLKDAGWTRVLQCGHVDENRRILFKDIEKYKRLWVVHRDCYPERATTRLYKSKPFKLLNPKFIYESRDGEVQLYELNPSGEEETEVLEGGS